MNYNLFRSVLMGVVVIALFSQYAGAFNLVLYGNVTNAQTCAPIAGANVFSSYNNYAFNLTSSTGQFRLYLGQGSWNVTVTAPGYQGGLYDTPSYFSGAWAHNFSLVPTGGHARSPPCFTNTTVINTTTTTPSGVGPTTPITNSTSSSASSSSTTYIVLAIIIVIIIIVAIWALMKGGKKGSQHAQHHQS